MRFRLILWALAAVDRGARSAPQQWPDSPGVAARRNPKPRPKAKAKPARRPTTSRNLRLAQIKRAQEQDRPGPAGTCHRR